MMTEQGDDRRAPVDGTAADADAVLDADADAAAAAANAPSDADAVAVAVAEDAHRTKPIQAMKPETAAKKLGIYLPATPTDFQTTPLTRAAFNAVLASPPTWLTELRQTGPHPRPVVAGKLGVSISGLARGGVTDALTSAEIQSLLVQPPAWLVEERSRQAAVRAEKAASANKKREIAP